MGQIYSPIRVNDASLINRDSANCSFVSMFVVVVMALVVVIVGVVVVIVFVVVAF